MSEEMNPNNSINVFTLALQTEILQTRMENLYLNFLAIIFTYYSRIGVKLPHGRQYVPWIGAMFMAVTGGQLTATSV